MARKPRIHYPGALYHVILRGNAHQDIFFDDEDRYRFYLLLQECMERYGHRIHAFCLMTNHVHMALQSGEVRLSRLMQNLSFRYTRWINWRQKRSGHLFQGRFKAVLVDADTYLLELVRYIHLNPIRAGIASNPGEYPWSSHKAYCGMEIIPWLTTEWVLSQFSEKKRQAINAYRNFLMDGIKEGHRAEFHRGNGEDSRVFGNDTFIEKVLGQSQQKLKRTLTLENLIDHVCRRYQLNKSLLKKRGKDRLMSEVRGVIAWFLLETGCGTLTELSKKTKRDISSLSSAARRLQQRAKSDRSLASTMKELLETIG
ncbi:MAG: transposase [Proteobacteria bacterium]|nr:transposase [Pseudomonadota bacterium]